MNPIAGNFDAARLQEVCNAAKQLAETAELKRTMNPRLQLLKSGAIQIGSALLTILIAVSIFTLPIKLIYVWGCFLWNLL